MTSQRKLLDYSPEDWWVLEPQIIGTAIDEIVLEVPGEQAGDAATISRRQRHSGFHFLIHSTPE